MRAPHNGAIILFDGVCNLCQTSVQFILKRDPKGYVRFASQQSMIGQQLLRQYAVPSSIDSIVLIEEGRCYVKSDAALRICKYLQGGWRLASWLLVVPRPVRHFLYDRIAKHRYSWFGKSESCMLPTPEYRGRFLE